MSVNPLDRLTVDAAANAPEAAHKPLFIAVGEIVRNLRAPDWIVKGYIEADSIAVAYGASGDGKTFVALDVACCVATGTPWHGHKVKPGPVVYICGEGANGLHRRLKAWSILNEVELDHAPLIVSTTAISLDDPSSEITARRAIESAVETLGTAPVLIVVDTLSRNFGGDENSSKDMAAFVRALDRLRHQWNATVLVVHHTGKDLTKGARGSSVLRAAVDAEFSVSMDEQRTVLVQAHKMKEAELPPPLAFTLQGVRLPLLDEDGGEVWSCAPVLTDSAQSAIQGVSRGRGKNQIAALSLLSELYREHGERLTAAGRDPSDASVRFDDWKERCRENGIQRQRFTEVRQALLDHKQIELVGPYVRDLTA